MASKRPQRSKLMCLRQFPEFFRGRLLLKFFEIFSRFCMKSERTDRQTDRQTDGLRIYIYTSGVPVPMVIKLIKHFF